jgi:hypothetical protein
MYIAMRLVPGGSLGEYLKHLDGPMDLSLAAKLTAQLASALQTAHDHDLVHQDVKPANVLLGRADWPLLSDFGIAGAGTREERGGHITGTPPCMSPEQWQGLSLDGASDQYSLALMFYQLVTRQLPFQADSRDELRGKVLSAPPLRPRELNPGIPGPVEEVMLRALAKQPQDRFESISDFSTALLESVERSRGMQLETKQALVESVVGLLAVAGISILGPALVGVANPDVPVIYQLTLNWPILVVLALAQAAVLLSIRWQLVGLLGRALGSGVDALDRLTRLYAQLGTDPRGPLNVQQWRNRVVGSAEYIVGIIYVLVLYGLVGVPLIKSVSEAWNVGQEPLIATVLAGLVLVLVGANLLAMWRVCGAVVATLALALCWVFIGTMPIIDRSGFGGISLQWLAKLAIGLAVVVALLSLRKRVQATAGAVFAPLLQRGLSRSRLTSNAEQTEADARRWSDALVNVGYCILIFPILAVPVRNLLEPLTSPTIAAVVITVVGVAMVVLIVDVLRRAQGFALAITGLFVCAPTLLGLPLWESGSVGSGLHWVVRCLIGLGILLLLIGLRSRARREARVLVVPMLDRQISALYAPRTEADAEARLHLLERVSDCLIDLLYVVCAYIAVGMPIVSALSASSFSGLITVVYLVFAAVAGLLLYRVWRQAGAAGLGSPTTEAAAEPELAASVA